MVSFRVVGTPGPQGSKKAIPISKKGPDGSRVFTGKVNMIESSTKVKPWRAQVAEQFKATGAAKINGAVSVGITFFLARPKAHYRTGKFAHLLKPTAPLYPEGKPDIDKLVRSTLDALTQSGAYHDDAKVVNLHVSKRFADHREPGAVIQLIPKAAATQAEAGPIGRLA